MRKRANDWRRYAAQLASYLADQGLRDRAWVDAFASLPRHEFLDTVVGFARADQVDVLRAAYADQVIVTREGYVDGRQQPLSSLSQPVIMAVMLQLLEVGGDERVLEIGTGTGYNAGLLCVRLGDHNVTSVDIASDLVDEARERLARLGYHPYLRAANGEAGCEERAPFDRVIATCGLNRIPQAWLPQLAPGARVVAPMNFGGALAVLDRGGDGSIGGRFASERGFFMQLRHPGTDGREQQPTTISSVRHDPAILNDGRFRAWLDLSLPRMRVDPVQDDDGRFSVEISDSGGDAEVGGEESSFRTSESGEPLWSRIEDVHAKWIEHGRPGIDRLGMTVSPERQWVWLDHPGSRVHWEL